MDNSATVTNNQKKLSLEQLSKEDLIKKYQQLLSIAQKAKLAKDELTEDNVAMKKNLEELENKLEEDTKAMREMLTVLTQQKLQLVTENDTLTKEKSVLNTEINKFKKELLEVQNKVQELDTENEHYNRQIKRLSEENDQLVNYLDTCEKQIEEYNKIGEQQRAQLLYLEKQTLKEEKRETSFETELNKYQILVQEKDTEIANLNEEIDNLKIKNEQTNQLKSFCQLKNDEIEELQKKIICLNEELVSTKKSREIYNEKLKTYHGKLIKVFSDLKELKQSKGKLLAIVNNYSQHVNKWQNEIKLISEKFKLEIEKRDADIHSYILEINNLKATLSKLELIKNSENLNDDVINNLKSELIVKDTNITDLQQEKSDLLNLIEDYKQKLELNEKSFMEKNEISNTLTIEKENLIKRDNLLTDTITNLEDQLLSLNETKIQMETKIQETEEKYKLILHEKEDLETNLSETKTKLTTEEKSLENLLSEKQELLEIIENNKKIIESLELNLNDMKSFEIKCNKLTHENNNLLEEINKNNVELKEYNLLKTTVKNLESQNDSLEKCLKNIKEENVALKNQVNILCDEIKVKTESYNDLLENSSKEKTDLLEKVNKFHNDLSSCQRELSELKNQLLSNKRENGELLKEMNYMNEALKERGETISRQQEYNDDLLKKIQKFEEETSNYNLEKNELEKEIKVLKNEATKQVISVSQEHNLLLEKKDDKIKSLEEEIQHLKDSFNSSFGIQDGGCGESETMSTSTISRIDEVSRLKDLEGSWEERYSKLRTLALKLKGKVKEQSEQLNQERVDKAEVQNKLVAKTKNLQSVQIEYDKLQDKFELLNKENKRIVKDYELLLNENEKCTQDSLDNLEALKKLQLEMELLRKEKIGSGEAAKQFLNQIQNLKHEIDQYIVRMKDLENKISKLEKNVNMKEDDYQNEVKAHNATKEKLQKIEKENKKNSVLSLEMDDYERSLKDMSHKLETKNDLISNLEEKIKTQENSIKMLTDELKVLEDKYLQEKETCQNFEQQLVELRAKISTVEATVAQKDNQVKEITVSFENYKIKSEEENTELTHILSQVQRHYQTLKTEKNHLKNVILGLEGTTKELTATIAKRDSEISRLKDDFSSYKIRAQSVLLQRQTKDIVIDERVKEELDELRTQKDFFEAQVETLSFKLHVVEDENNDLIDEKNQMTTHCLELESLLAKAKDDNNNLLERQQQLIMEHKEAIRAQKIHLDTLIQCYKQQLAEQESRHVQEIAKLQAIQSETNANTINKSQEEADVTSLLREDAEGSESIESNTNTKFAKSPISLDKLLNSDIENNSTYDSEAELITYKKQLSEYETKVKHLSDLLADAEQDLAKYVQLNQLLKEDIRRHQRSVEREKHAENLEYLKNVIFKFLTLCNGDEKCHLVPVLTTILKLSPEETQKLNAVANGTDPSVKGWGSYLPIWSPTNK